MTESKTCRCRAVAVLLAIAALVALPVAFPPDGQTRVDLLRFVGRFHPLVVHLPIALLLVVPLLRRWSAKPGHGEAARFALGLGAWTAVASALIGWTLAYADGNTGGTVTLHMWGGVATSIAALLAWLAFETRPGFYRLAMFVAVIGLFATGHWGGQLTHGENYLVEHLPGFGKAASGTTATAAGSASTVYAAAVAPALDDHCTQCHNEKKQKGKLRLDSLAAMTKGGEAGPAVVPFDTGTSELLKRITLPPEHEDFMPPDGKPSLPEARVELLKWWIAHGATETQLVADVKDAPPAVAKLLATAAKKPAVPLVPDYTPQLASLQAAAKSVGVRLDPVSRVAGDGLVLRTIDAAAKFGDRELAALTNAGPFVVDAELARTQVTDAGLAALKSFPALRSLDLARTKVNGSGLPSLPKLEKLNLVGTAADDAAIERIAGSASLRKVYLFDTKLTTNGVEKLRTRLKDAAIDTGVVVQPVVAPAAEKKG